MLRLVCDPRDEMSRFVTGMSDDFKKKCRSDMLHNDMNISHIMVHSQHVEEARSKRNNIYAKSARSFDICSSKNRP